MKYEKDYFQKNFLEKYHKDNYIDILKTSHCEYFDFNPEVYYIYFDSIIEFYKIINPIEIHTGEKYLYSYIKYESLSGEIPSIDYVFKSGRISNEEFRQNCDDCSQQISWTDDENFKQTTASKEDAEKIISSDIICYFGPEPEFFLLRCFYLSNL